MLASLDCGRIWEFKEHKLQFYIGIGDSEAKEPLPPSRGGV